MLKLIVALIIVAIGGWIGYLFVFQNCAGGVIVREAAQWRAQGFDSVFCGEFQKRLLTEAMNAATVYPAEAACRDRQAACVARENPRGWSPVPAALCLVRDGDRIARVEPVYEPAGARRID